MTVIDLAVVDGEIAGINTTATATASGNIDAGCFQAREHRP